MITGDFCLSVAEMNWKLFHSKWEGHFEREDAIQEMALSIWKQRDTWVEDRGCTAKSWFSIVARRHMYHLLKALGRLKRTNGMTVYSLDKAIDESGDTWAEVLPSLGSDPVGPIEVDIIVEGVRKAVGELPDQQRVAMDEMLDELSLFQSASKHNVSRQAISNRRKNGMKNLANKPWLGRLVSG